MVSLKVHNTSRFRLPHGEEAAYTLYISRYIFSEYTAILLGEPGRLGNHSTMAAGVMRVALFVVWLTICGCSSFSVAREVLVKNGTRNSTDIDASAAASFFLGNDTTTTVPSTTPPSAGTTWCVAKNNIDDATLQQALDYACGLGGADCTKIQQGSVCFEPDNVQSHASYAFNSYYVKNGLLPGACDFGGSAAPTTLNPSHGDCVFETSSTAGSVNGTLPGGGGAITGGPSTSNSSGAGAALPLIASSLLIVISLVVMKFDERL